MKERKNRAKKIRGVKKVSTSQELLLVFPLFWYISIMFAAQFFADKGWRCQEEVREEVTCLAISLIIGFGLFRVGAPSGNAECLVRSREDFAN
jgi:hypothetical protein